MNRTERKVIEKLALSAYALHLYEGLTIKEQYTLGEVIRYWRYAQGGPGAWAYRMYMSELNIYELMDAYERNVEALETLIKNRVVEYVKNGTVDLIRDAQDRVEVSAASLPKRFELRAFPGVTLQVIQTFSYVDDDKRVQLVLERMDTLDHFGKGTVEEIKAQIAREVK